MLFADSVDELNHDKTPKDDLGRGIEAFSPKRDVFRMTFSPKSLP